MKYKCVFFKIKELVHPSFLKTSEVVLWRLFNEQLLRSADNIRRKYGACTVNADGLTDCGLRQMDSKTGAMFSAHKFGCALDLHIRIIELAALKIEDRDERKKWKIAEYNKVRRELIKDHDFDCLCFEDNIPWLHVATQNRKSRLFNP